MTLSEELSGLHALSLPNENEAAPLLICLHGFGDHSGMFAPLFRTALARSFRLIAPDLPGCGRSAPDRGISSIDLVSHRIERLLNQVDKSAPIALVGHSLASAIAVMTAERLGGRCLGVFSIEGNLTAKDAYFSGQAVKWDDAAAFKAHLVKGTRNMANFRPELVRYADALEMADATTLWQLGQDAYHCSQEDGLGARYRALPCPTLYYWCGKTTSAVTQSYLRAHDLDSLEYTAAGHWPTIDAPVACAEAIAKFFGPHIPVT